MVIEKGLKLTYDISHASRLVDADAYKIQSADMLFGFVSGICEMCIRDRHKGLLQGKKATAFPKFQQELEGAVLSADYVCQDGNIPVSYTHLDPRHVCTGALSYDGKPGQQFHGVLVRLFRCGSQLMV